MKQITTILITNMASIACIVSSSILAFNGKNGWGWFLAVGFLTNKSLKIIERVTTEKDSDS